VAAGLTCNRCFCSCLRHGHIASVVSSEWASQGTGACFKTPSLLLHQVPSEDLDSFRNHSLSLHQAPSGLISRPCSKKTTQSPACSKELLALPANAIAPPMPLAELNQGEHIRYAPVREQEGLYGRLLPIRLLIDLIPPLVPVNVMRVSELAYELQHRHRSGACLW